ncbi:Aste57867_23672 [Aphanomyces stellatus]|uniref:Aste57867_23672 protein n=1 Tax=Aphanomyces stellatus TaxID=120398 RepID=A0A485LNA3_9STRA|nr:hypothetical protein As57867_023600 [Aphanomyces stellatus]VFU00317.1 Aste57867_23672 [Aphanomyces stellatus]
MPRASLFLLAFVLVSLATAQIVDLPPCDDAHLAPLAHAINNSAFDTPCQLDTNISLSDVFFAAHVLPTPDQELKFAQSIACLKLVDDVANKANLTSSCALWGVPLDLLLAEDFSSWSSLKARAAATQTEPRTVSVVVVVPTNATGMPLEPATDEPTTDEPASETSAPATTAQLPPAPMQRSSGSTVVDAVATAIVVACCTFSA